MHLLNDSPVHISVQASLRFYSVSAEIINYLKYPANETSPTGEHPLTQAAPCEESHDRCLHASALRHHRMSKVRPGRKIQASILESVSIEIFIK